MKTILRQVRHYT